MSWVSRINAHNFDGIQFVDSVAASTTSYLGTATAGTAVQDLMAGMFALKPSGGSPGRWVQENSFTSNNGYNVPSQAIAFNADVAPGSCLVVVVFGLIFSGPVATITVTDSQGNTYTQAAGGYVPGTADYAIAYVAPNAVGGPCTVTVSANFTMANITAGIVEYSGIALSSPVRSQQSGYDIHSAGVVGPLSIAATRNDVLCMYSLIHQYIGVTLTGGGSLPFEPCTEGWLMIDEPGLGFVDQSERIWENGTFNFSQIIRQRGTSTVQLYVAAGDDYQPTTGSQVCIWNLTDDGNFHEFAGFIAGWKWEDYLTNAGNRIATLTMVSLERVFDVIVVPGRLYESQTCGAIFADLFSLASGSPVNFGQVDDGPTIAQFLVTGSPKVSELFDKLATLAGFIWGVDPDTNDVYFHLPNVTAAPFTLETTDLKYRQFNYGEDQNDYRNRQIIRLSFDAFSHSSELIAPATQSSITLKHKVQEVTNAWFTLNTQNTATGTFTGLPNDGDTITINGGGSTWAANNLLAFAISVIDPNGNVQRSTTLGTTGAVQPTWNTVKGGTTSDNTVIWTNQGPVGLSNIAPLIYTFKSVLDNREFGQVLIGSTAAITAQNFVDAINAKEDSRAPDGSNPVFSLPTWENSNINADDASGGTFTVRDKSAGQAYIASLSESCSNFTWSATQTSGGTTTFGTSVCPVAVSGNASTGLVYTPGSDVVTLAVPLVTFSLQIEYTRLDGDQIAVEDTDEVLIRAAIEHSNGKYQQVMSDDSASAISGLAEAQSALEAYSTIPKAFEFETLTPGLRTGTKLTISLTDPEGLDDLLNAGEWFIQEINATRIPGTTWNLGYPHFLYTVKVINVAQIGSWVAFWEQLAGGSGGASSTAPSPGGGSQPPVSGSVNKYATTFTAATSVTVTHNLNTLNVTIGIYDASGEVLIPSSTVVTSTNMVTLTFSVAATGTVTVMG